VIFGTSSEHHFQVWIPLSANNAVRFAYDPRALPAAPPAGLKVLVGTENVAGSAGAQQKGVTGAVGMTGGM